MMDVLINFITVITLCIYLCQVILLYTLNLHVICPLYLTKDGTKKCDENR